MDASNVKKGFAGKKAGGPKKKSISRSMKASLQFLVGRISCFLKKGKHAPRVGIGAPIYLAVMLEYLVAEVLELARNAVRDNKKNSITLGHLLLIIRNNEELGKIFHGVSIAHGGVLPNINLVLLPKKSEKAASKEPKSPKSSSKAAKLPKKAKA